MNYLSTHSANFSFATLRNGCLGTEKMSEYSVAVQIVIFRKVSNLACIKNVNENKGCMGICYVDTINL